MHNPAFEDVIASIEQALEGNVAPLVESGADYPVEGSQVGINPTNQC